MSTISHVHYLLPNAPVETLSDSDALMSSPVKHKT